MLDFFKVLFGSKKLIIPLKDKDEDEEKSLVNLSSNDNINLPIIPPKPNIISKPQKPLAVTKKTDIIDTTIKDIIMSEIFLVVIDTTGRVEAKNFQPGVQNFYFVFATDEQTAKHIVLSTFNKRPGMMDQLVNGTKATRLQSIVKNMGQGSNFWTYVPFGGQRQPGQQGIPPSPDKLLRNNEYGSPSSQAYVPSAPVGGEEITADDLRGVQFSGADGKIMNKLRSGTGVSIDEEAPPLNPEQQIMMGAVQEQNKMLADQNKAMMEQMTTMMALVKATASQVAVAPKGRKAKAKVIVEDQSDQ
jgi:hypothetical protein